MKWILLMLLLTSQFSCTEPESNNISIARNYFENLFRKGDFASIKTQIKENAIYNQAPGLPYGGTYKGFENWMTMFSKVQDYFSIEIVDNPVLYSNPENDKVTAVFTIKFKSKTSNRELVMPISELLEFENGKIAKITPFYFDTKALVEFIAASEN